MSAVPLAEAPLLLPAGKTSNARHRPFGRSSSNRHMSPASVTVNKLLLAELLKLSPMDVFQGLVSAIWRNFHS